MYAVKPLHARGRPNATPLPVLVSDPLLLLLRLLPLPYWPYAAAVDLGFRLLHTRYSTELDVVPSVEGAQACAFIAEVILKAENTTFLVACT